MSDMPLKTEGEHQAPLTWNPARPDKIPEPTVWPATVALAVTLLLWGVASSLIISAIGLVLFVVGLGCWIGNIRHERKNS
jgi:hypothetical protein